MQALFEVVAMPVARQALVLKMGHSLRAVHLQRIKMNGVVAGSVGSGSSNQIEPEVPVCASCPGREQAAISRCMARSSLRIQ